MRIHPGWLNERITLQSPATGQDASGEPLSGWVDVATIWASLTDVTGREYIAAGGLQNNVQTKILIRYMDGVMPRMRVVHGVSVYNIEAVLGQDHLSLMLMCSRGLNNG